MSVPAALAAAVADALGVETVAAAADARAGLGAGTVKPAAFEYRRAETLDRRARAARGGRPRCEAPRRRPEPYAAPEHAIRATLAARRPERHTESRSARVGGRIRPHRRTRPAERARLDARARSDPSARGMRAADRPLRDQEPRHSGWLDRPRRRRRRAAGGARHPRRNSGDPVAFGANASCPRRSSSSPTSRPRSLPERSSRTPSGRPVGAGWGYAFEELAQRHGDFALGIAACAASRRGRPGG